MEILPVINCEDVGCIRERAEESVQLLGASCWVHLDVADGGLTDGYATWRDSQALRTLISPEIKIELHLMVREAMLALPAWLSAGINRVIVHISTIESLEAVKNMCEPYGVAVFLGVAPQEALESVLKEGEHADGFHVLAVHPGRSGQVFMVQALETMRTIKQRFPEKTISVDGGVTLEVARECARAGATRCAVSTALWSAADPQKVLEDFSAIH